MDVLKLLHAKRPKTIGVDGNSGSGKTSLAKALADALDGQVISLDFFHKHERKDWHLQPDMNDFEDLEKLDRVMRRLRAGESFTLDDLYEFVSGTHIASCRFESRPVLIVEGMCTARLPLDFKILLCVDPAVALARAKKRDLKERGLTEEQWVVKKRLFHYEYPKLMPELKQKADLVIDTTDHFPILS